MTPYAEMLLAKRAAIEATTRPLQFIKDSSKRMILSFRLWEAGFNAFENGIPVACCNSEQARQGWHAAQKCKEWLETREFDKLDLRAIVERIQWMY